MRATAPWTGVLTMLMPMPPIIVRNHAIGGAYALDEFLTMGSAVTQTDDKLSPVG
jgi:hypothetical protein